MYSNTYFDDSNLLEMKNMDEKAKSYFSYVLEHCYELNYIKNIIEGIEKK